MSINEIAIIYEDNDILVVDKPPGMPTQSTVDKNRANLYDILRNSKRWPYLGLHHRLDVPTSGVLLLVKNRTYNKAIADAFRERTIHKTYYCLIRSIPDWKNISIENHLGSHKLKNGKTKMEVVHSGGDFAHTDFKVAAQTPVGEPPASLIEAMPRTGRMHQIRIHLSLLGFPILGDALYGRVHPDFKRLLLHAGILEFKHPRTGKELVLKSGLPKDFTDALTLLKVPLPTP